MKITEIAQCFGPEERYEVIVEHENRYYGRYFAECPSQEAIWLCWIKQKFTLIEDK